jgi:hypothetical protein
VKYTLGAKFGGPAQRWDKVGLEEGRAVANHVGEGTRIEYGRWGSAWKGNKWRPHGGGTKGAMACLLLHREATLVIVY